MQYSVTLRNAQLATIAATIGPSPTLEICSGAKPANCAAADSGTVLATLVLPVNWMDDPVAAVVGKAGTWQDLAADDAGVAGHFRIKQGATCHMQGSCGLAEDSPDMVLDNVNVNVGALVVVQAFNIAAGNG
jgi:hypothetical protein